MQNSEFQIKPFVVQVQGPRTLTPYTRYRITWHGITLRDQISMPCLNQCCDAAFMSGSRLTKAQQDTLRRSRAIIGYFANPLTTPESSTLLPAGTAHKKSQSRGTKAAVKGVAGRAWKKAQANKPKNSQLWCDGKVPVYEEDES